MNCYKSSAYRRLLLILVVIVGQGVAAAADEKLLQNVVFPGIDPGNAVGSTANGTLRLSNSVISASWQLVNGQLHPVELIDKLSVKHFNQRSCEPFWLATHPTAAAPDKGIWVRIGLNVDTVVASASRDGLNWCDIASFPRGDFSDEPRSIRIGKMDANAQATDYTGDLGPAGACEITDVLPAPLAPARSRFEFRTNANKASLKELPFPKGCETVTCRIDKQTDQGLTWGPALSLVWDDGKKFLLVGLRGNEPTFNIETAGNQRIVSVPLTIYPKFDLPSSSFHLSTNPKLIRLTGDVNGIRVADRIGGWAIVAEGADDDGLHVQWRAELRDGSNYIRQTIELTTPGKRFSLAAVELADLRVPDLRTIGTCPGCPVAGSGIFAGVEMPGSTNAISPDEGRIGFECKLEVSPNQSYRFGQVVGVFNPGQLRRSFLYYIERERARPSKPFLHYNSWYDLGYDVDEKQLLEVVKAFTEELVVKRGVPVNSYLVDDGWDDTNRGLWAENLQRFPGGFKKMRPALTKVDAHLGVWISPLGGYSGQEQRRDKAREMGLIPRDADLDLSVPLYKQWFKDRCLQLMHDAGVNIFKWDKAGDGVSPHFMALLDIAQSLRAANHNLFIDVTVGTWPSPFWLNFVDCTWRNGSGDVGWVGKGNDPNNPQYDREKWLTFRDGYCHQLFVMKSPLYPLNSVMHHGIVLGRHFQGESVAKSGANLKHEARSYFATGATLQELYLSPSLMTPHAWDDVAEAAKWSHSNADVLVDSHWIGGDPLKLEPYGYASWSTRKGIIMLRNPNDIATPIKIDVGKMFELAPDSPTHFKVTSPYPDVPSPISALDVNVPIVISLQPFEVLVVDLVGTR